MDGRAPHGRRLVVVLAALAAAGDARGSGWTLYLEPGFLAEEVDTTDQAGLGTSQDVLGLTQNYQLLVDEDLLSNLRLSGGGNLRKLTTWTHEEGDGGTVRGDESTSDAFARLTLGAPTLRAVAGVDRRRRASTFGPAFTTDRLTLSGNWRPVDLPELDLVLSRTHDWTSDRAFVDDTTDGALLTARYVAERLDLRWIAGWATRRDRPTSTDMRSIDQTLQATWSDRVLWDRTRVYASATVQSRTLSVTYSGTAGVVEQQVFPVAGLSAVEVPPALPGEITLTVNRALTDGDLLTSAGVNLGLRPALSGDRNPRELGAQLADLVTDVNRVYVWVVAGEGARLPPEVAGRFSFTAWKSDDNLHWTPVAVLSSVYGEVHDRFEIAIATTRGARYVKVVTAPLPADATTDRRFLDVFVTELQLATVVPASSVPGTETTTIASFAGAATTVLLRAPGTLSHDLSVEFWRLSNARALTAWTVVNGLSWSERLGRALSLDVRLDHRDQDVGSGHEGQADWAGSVIARPLPTFTSALTYSGSYTERYRTITNAVALNNRAEIWDGVSAQANGGFSVSTLPDGAASTTVLANAIVSLVANRWVTVSTGWLYNRNWLKGGYREDATSTFHRIDATASVTPGSVVSLFASASRIIAGMRPTTLASVQLNYAPFRGDLQLAITTSRSLDTAADATSDLFSPSLRWNVRSNVYLNAAWSLLDASSPAISTRSRVASASLVVNL